MHFKDMSNQKVISLFGPSCTTIFEELFPSGALKLRLYTDQLG